jgi:benzodiazapine receptor
MKKWIANAGWVLLPFVAAAAGVQSSAARYYATLAKPTWAPPAWLFGPVWLVLYLLVGIAAAMVWNRFGYRGARDALSLFVLQLAVNAAWSPVFFGLQQIEAALVVICALDLLVLATIAAFAHKDRRAALLLAPYLAWICFASALNFAIMRLN